MKKLTGFIARKSGLILSLLAVAVGTASVNSACVFWYHQPKVPQGMDKFKRW